MLQAASNLAPRGVYVCGNTTSAAGLTVRDNLNFASILGVHACMFVYMHVCSCTCNK